MSRRKKLKSHTSVEGLYFDKPAASLRFFSSGCQLLDCALGGGYPLGRISNIVGDKSTGKTLLAIEAMANFNLAFPDGNIWYNEVEASFDKSYAHALGLPTDRVSFVSEDEEGECFTIEDFYEDLSIRIEQTEEEKSPGLYILDSLDALSDRTELGEEIDKSTYGTSKAKQMSKLFRKLNQRMCRRPMHLMIISQVRDNIGVTFGKRYARSGGKGLDFYASQVVYLAHLKALDKKRHGIKRPIGIIVKAKIEKNKVGLPLRVVEFPIIFGYGVDDLAAGIDWLMEVGALKEIGLTQKEAKSLARNSRAMDLKDYQRAANRVSKAVRKVWSEVETSFLPKHGKYGAR